MKLDEVFGLSKKEKAVKTKKEQIVKLQTLAEKGKMPQPREIMSLFWTGSFKNWSNESLVWLGLKAADMMLSTVR